MNSGYFYAPYVPMEREVIENMQMTMAMLKPDCARKVLIGRVFSQLEQNFQILAIKTIWLEQCDVDFLYGKYKDEPFYKDLSDFMQSDRCHLICLQGVNAVERLRAIIGAEAPTPGTIRGDFGNKKIRRENIIHASDSLEAAKKEIDFFFCGTEQESLGFARLQGINKPGAD